MSKLLKLTWFVDLCMGVSLLLAFAGLVLNPRETSEAAKEGIRICLDIIIPSLFPFFVLASLTIELGLTRYIGVALERVMRPLFRVSGPCSAAVVLGFLGGYPVGAKTAISLYEKKLCSKEEAERLLAFCNNSGPAFILGAVGAGIMGSSEAGWLLYLTHTAASLTVGFIFRFYKYKSPPSVVDTGRERKVVRLSDAFTTSVKSSFMSVIFISAFVIFFTVAIRLLFITGVIPSVAGWLGGLLAPIGLNSEKIQPILTGLIEITSGLWNMQGGASTILAGKMAMAAFMLGWAGLSVHCQVLSFIGESGLSPWTYLIGKMMHGLISAAYTAIVVSAMGYTAPVSVYLAEQVQEIANLSFATTLKITIKVLLGVGIGFFLVSALILAKRKKRY